MPAADQGRLGTARLAALATGAAGSSGKAGWMVVAKSSSAPLSVDSHSTPRAVTGGNLRGDEIVGQAAPQAVGAQQHAVAAFQPQRPGRIHHRLARAAEAGEEHVAADPLAATGRPRGPLQLVEGMVARAHDQFAVAHQVEPRVAAMRPPRGIGLHHAGDQGGARRVVQPLARGVIAQQVVSGQQAVVQERGRVGQCGRGVALEGGGQRLQRQLGRDIAFGVAAHAVGQREQPGLAGVAVAHAVLVLRPPTLAADLVDAEPHLGGALRLSSCSLSRSLKLSLV